ncbi:MAG: hypothetical protein R3F35_01060 [Myxococcota bacterium]
MSESLRHLGDFVAGIGVVVILVYLVIQVRPNSAANVTTPGGRVCSEEIGRPMSPPRMVKAVDACLHVGGLPDVLAWPHFPLAREEAAFPRPAAC